MGGLKGVNSGVKKRDMAYSEAAAPLNAKVSRRWMAINILMDNWKKIELI